MEEISERLLAAAQLAAAGFAPGGSRCLADIGTDHALLPIYMVRHGLADSALALDVRRGPLERARQHVQEAGLAGSITCRLSDGLEGVRRGEADVFVICGMGGHLIEKILSAGKDRLTERSRIVAGPQLDVPDFRAFAVREGWRIRCERMVRENGKFYTLMLLERGEEVEPLTDVELHYGRQLLTGRDPVLRDYLVREKKLTDRIREQLTGKESPGARLRLSQLSRQEALLDKAFLYYR